MHTDPAKLKRGRISRAIIAILMLAVFNLVGFIFFFIMSHNNHLELLTQQVIVDSEHSFNTIESDKLRYLNTTLALLMANRAIANAFKERDREALLALCLPLFNHIKRNNGITHWYFHEAEPDKRCFLRIHKPDLYGDRITRITFDRAIETKQLASGKELGKTALAIRAVHPFYLDEALIGYIELGVDIDYLFRNFVATTGNHYGLFVEKSLLDRFKWDSVRSVKRLRDSWDDHNRYLLLYQTPLLDRIDPDLKKGNFIGAIPDQAKAFNRIVRGRNAYSRGMFPFYDVLGRKIGAVYILRNFNQHVSLVRSKSMFFIVMTFLFVGIVTFLMVFLHKRGER